MTTKTEKFILDQVRRILSEEKEEEKSGAKKRPKGRGNIRRGKIGAGGVKADIRKAKAMAEKNPQKLMDNLKIPGSIEGNTIPKKVLNLVRAAIYGTELMRSAYSGATLDETPKKSIVRVATAELTPRDGTLYMTHTLYGAERAGILKDTGHEIVVNRGSTGVEIVLTKLS